MSDEFLIKKVLTVEEAFNLALIDSASPLELKKQIKAEIQHAQIGDSKLP